MDQKDLRTLKIFEKIEDEQPPSQRALAKELGISLGLVNSFIKRLVNKGYFKVTNIPKNRVRYLLTPKGIAEKTRLTYLYIQYSYEFYRNARKKLGELFQKLETEGVRRVVFYGVSDFAEIAYLSLQETPIKLAAVSDNIKIGGNFFGLQIISPMKLQNITFDRLIITELTPGNEDSHNGIINAGIPRRKITIPNSI